MTVLPPCHAAWPEPSANWRFILAGLSCRAGLSQHHTVPPIGGTIPVGRSAGGKLGSRRKPPKGGKQRTPIGVLKNRPPCRGAADRRRRNAAGRSAGGPCRDARWRPLRHPVGDAATPPQACEVCERRVCERRVCECASAGGTLQKRSSPGVPYRTCGTLRVLRPLRSGRRDSGGRPLSSPWNPGSGPSAYDTYTAAPQACR